MSLSRYRLQRNWGARVLEYEFKGMSAVFLENEKLRVGVLAGKGTDVFEFNYKPRDMDFVCLTSRGVQNPMAYLSTSPDPLATFLDYYPGGWQEIFPNGGPPSSYLGAHFGQHGEVSHLPWDYHIIEDSEDAVAVLFSVRTQKMPFRIEKELRLLAAESCLRVEEALVNESPVPLRAMWGHHITFGRPFAGEACLIRLPDGVSVVPHDEAINQKGRRVKADKNYTWPYAERETGGQIDLSVLPPGGELSEMLYLAGFTEGWYEVENRQKQLAFRLEWDVERMPYLWFWQEYGASEGYPWYGRHYSIGLEPFTSYPTSGLARAVENDTALSIGPHERLQFSFRATAVET